VFNKRTRVIMESIHVNFDELPQMASVHNCTDLGPTRHAMASVHNCTDPGPTRQAMASVHNCTDPGPTRQAMASVQNSTDPGPTCQRMASAHNSSDPAPSCQTKESVQISSDPAPECTTSNELDLLFSLMFDELLNRSSKVVSKSSAVSAADAPNQRQQPSVPLNNHTTPAPTCQNPPITTTVISSENITQAEPHAVNDQVADDEFINIFSTPVQDQGETSSRHKFLGMVKFGNDQIAPILGYGYLVQGAITIKRVYYVEGLNHNLFSVGQFCDADLEVAFRKSTCFIRDLKGNDLLTGSRGIDLYSITLQSTSSPNPICLMAKATSSQAWLWHRRLSHLNFDTINLLSKNDIVVGLPKLKFFKDHLCSSCELGKAKRKSFHTKLTPSSKWQLHLLHMDLCSPMRVASINGKRYVLVIVDDYSRYTWTHFLRVVRTDKGTEFLNHTLHAYFVAEGIQHQTSIARTPEQNGVVERRNRTLVEAARTMLSAAKVPLLFWAEAIATACFTQNHGENLDKMKGKGDECIFVGYSTQSRAYRVFNKRTRVIVESIHVNFNELPQMASAHNSSDPAPTCQTMALVQISSDPAPECQTMALEQVVSKSSAVSAADALNQRQQPTTPLNNHTTPVPTCQTPPITITVISSENINQAEPHAKNDQVADNKFINIFSTPVQDKGRRRHV
nr:retrovirus-related Pol polyprotein from transposon TNT 1-94 [Tanacetum cinerariifolium]